MVRLESKIVDSQSNGLYLKNMWPVFTTKQIQRSFEVVRVTILFHSINKTSTLTPRSLGLVSRVPHRTRYRRHIPLHVFRSKLSSRVRFCLVSAWPRDTVWPRLRPYSRFSEGKEINKNCFQRVNTQCIRFWTKPLQNGQLCGFPARAVIKLSVGRTIII